MNLKRARKLMLIETMCIKKANTCDRDCANCELVQKDDELLEAYKLAIEALEEKIRKEKNND